MSQRREEVRRIDNSTNGLYYRYFVPTGLIANDEVNGIDGVLIAYRNAKKLYSTYKNKSYKDMAPCTTVFILIDEIKKVSDIISDKNWVSIINSWKIEEFEISNSFLIFSNFIILFLKY